MRGQDTGCGANATPLACRIVVGVAAATLLLGSCSDDSEPEDSIPPVEDAESGSSSTVPPASEQIGDEASTATFEVPPDLAEMLPELPEGAYVPEEFEIENVERFEFEGVVVKGAWSVEGRMPGELEEVWAQIEDAYAPTLPIEKTVTHRTFLTPSHSVLYSAFPDGDDRTFLMIFTTPLDVRLPADP
jgi:hypothetical protein